MSFHIWAEPTRRQTAGAAVRLWDGEPDDKTRRAWTYGMEGERQKREHIWTGIRTAKEAKKGGGDRRLGLAPATGAGGAGTGV